MEQILVRNLPEGTKAALRDRASSHNRSVEAEARAILTDVLQRESRSLVDLVSMDVGVQIEFEPDRLGLRARTPDL